MAVDVIIASCVAGFTALISLICFQLRTTKIKEIQLCHQCLTLRRSITGVQTPRDSRNLNNFLNEGQSKKTRRNSI